MIPSEGGNIKYPATLIVPGTNVEFLPGLRESVLPPVEPGKANPRLVLAK
jgi:hypothetical protein